MPYGIPEEKGGDSAKNILKMKHCIESVMKKHANLDKSSAIAICKKQMGFTKDGDED